MLRRKDKNCKSISIKKALSASTFSNAAIECNHIYSMARQKRSIRNSNTKKNNDYIITRDKDTYILPNLVLVVHEPFKIEIIKIWFILTSDP